jgi:prophage regulatory protein
MPEPDRIIRLKNVLNRSGLSRSTVYRKINEGTFPPQVKVSLNGVGWRESELNRWIANPVVYRPAAQAAV